MDNCGGVGQCLPGADTVAPPTRIHIHNHPHLCQNINTVRRKSPEMGAPVWHGPRLMSLFK